MVSETLLHSSLERRPLISTMTGSYSPSQPQSALQCGVLRSPNSSPATTCPPSLKPYQLAKPDTSTLYSRPKAKESTLITMAPPPEQPTFPPMSSWLIKYDSDKYLHVVLLSDPLAGDTIDDLTRIIQEGSDYGRKKEPPRGINGLLTDITHHGGPYVTINTIPQTVSFRISSTSPSSRRSTAGTRVPMRRRPAQGGGARVWVGGGFRPVSGGPAGAREDPAHAGGVARPADSSALPAVIPMATTPTTSPPTRIHKLLLGGTQSPARRWPRSRRISRFENGVGRSALYELGRELAMRVIERHQRRLDGRARRITIDLDPTDDATHGAQQLTLLQRALR